MAKLIILSILQVGLILMIAVSTLIIGLIAEYRSKKPRTKKEKNFRRITVTSLILLCLATITYSMMEIPTADTQPTEPAGLRIALSQSSKKIAEQNSTIIVLIDDLSNIKMKEIVKAAELKKEKIIEEISESARAATQRTLSKIEEGYLKNAPKKILACYNLQNLLVYKLLQQQAEIDSILVDDEKMDQNIVDRMKSMTPEMIQKLNTFIEQQEGKTDFSSRRIYIKDLKKFFLIIG
nr:hypothetical protein [uncultured Pedobacter sp.]